MPLWNQWRQKPPQGTQIDRTHPFAIGLKAFFAFNEAGGVPLEILNGRAPSSSTALTWVNNQAGISGSFNGSNTDLTYTGIPDIGPAMSVAVSVSISTATNAAMLIERETVNSIWELFIDGYLASNAFFWRGGSTTVRFQSGATVSGLGLTSLTPWQFIIADDGLTSGSKIAGYINGTPTANLGDPTGTAPVSTTTPIHLGSYDNSGFFTNGTIYYVAIWDHQLSASVATAITASPNAIWQMFQPPQAYWLMDAAAAATGGSNYWGRSAFCPTNRPIPNPILMKLRG